MMYSNFLNKPLLVGLLTVLVKNSNSLNTLLTSTLCLSITPKEHHKQAGPDYMTEPSHQFKIVYQVQSHLLSGNS